MKPKANPLFLAAVSLGAFTPFSLAQAQSIPSPYAFLERNQEATLFAGNQNMGTGRFGFGPRSGVAVGGRYGINLSGPFGLEAALTYLPTTRDIVDPGRDEGDRVVGDVAANMIVLDGRLRFSLTGDRSWHGLSPFLAVGGGLAFDASRDDADKDAILPDDVFGFGTSFVGVLGGGFRWFPGNRFLVRGDIELMIWRLDTPVGYTDPERGFEGVEENEWVSGSSFSLGMGFLF